MYRHYYYKCQNKCLKLVRNLLMMTCISSKSTKWLNNFTKVKAVWPLVLSLTIKKRKIKKYGT